MVIRYSEIIIEYCLTLFQINHVLDATISPVYYLTFIYSSTYFGYPHAHHQELNNYSSSLWFYLRNVVIAVLLVVVGPMKNFSDIIGNRTRDLPAFSAVPQPTAPPLAPW